MNNFVKLSMRKFEKILSARKYLSKRQNQYYHFFQFRQKIRKNLSYLPKPTNLKMLWAQFSDTFCARNSDNMTTVAHTRGVARGGPGGPQPPPRNLTGQLIIFNPGWAECVPHTTASPPSPRIQKATYTSAYYLDSDEKGLERIAKEECFYICHSFLFPSYYQYTPANLS